jgi:hypothetical protein
MWRVFSQRHWYTVSLQRRANSSTIALEQLVNTTSGAVHPNQSITQIVKVFHDVPDITDVDFPVTPVLFRPLG